MFGRAACRSAAGAVLLLGAGCRAAAAAGWPDLGRPARVVGGGGSDAAVVVGIENYAFLPPVTGARANALAWYDYLTRTRKVPADHVVLLRDGEATAERMRRAVEKVSREMEGEGALWFVFVGHGAPGEADRDGLLVGVDAQQSADSLPIRSLRQDELLRSMRKSGAGSIHVVMDACFSGLTSRGAPLVPGLQDISVKPVSIPRDPRFVFLAAARADEYAGPLPGTDRPAFSYLALGGLRGWADENADGRVTAGEVVRYVSSVLRATLRDRNQTPDLFGNAEAVLADSGGEPAPDLAALAREEPGPGFRLSDLAPIPEVKTPKALPQLSHAGWKETDVEALERYDEMVRFDKGDAKPGKKIERWRDFAEEVPRYADAARKRAAEWEQFIHQEEEAELARQRKEEAREADWEKLKRLLPLGVVPAADKERWARMFLDAYGESEREDPHAPELAKYLPGAPPPAAKEDRAADAPGRAAGDAEAGRAQPAFRKHLFKFALGSTGGAFGREQGIDLAQGGGAFSFQYLYRRSPRFRYGGELTHAGFDTARSWTGWAEWESKLNVTALSALLRYDFLIGRRWTPFVTAGAGMNSVRLKVRTKLAHGYCWNNNNLPSNNPWWNAEPCPADTSNFVSTYEGDKGGVTASLGVGTDFRVTERLVGDLELRWRYVGCSGFRSPLFRPEMPSRVLAGGWLATILLSLGWVW